MTLEPEGSLSVEQPGTIVERMHHAKFHPRLGGFERRSLVVLLMALLSLTLIGEPAWAHGGQSATEGYVMVQQALSYLVNDPSPAGTQHSLGKVNEALAAEDQDGVAVADVQRATAALTAGDTATARRLLQHSIAEAIAALKPAVGAETGTTIMVSPFVSRGTLTVRDWVFLVLSALMAIGGAILAFRFRPREGMTDLRRDILNVEGIRHQSSQLTSHGPDNDAL